MKEPQIEKSALSEDQQRQIDKVVKAKPVNMIQKTLNINENEENGRIKSY